jgi:HD-GYP domain-containing protein (c-di-GMP phosphodiesterase class II)
MWEGAWRAAAFTTAVARYIGFSREEITVMAQGAFLHDIGMLAIPDPIRRKTEPLTTKERALIREHPSIGYEFTRRTPFLSGAAEIIHCHQERFDGKGYPSRLKGSEIPLSARIVSLAVALDAITSKRPYRHPATFYEARPRIARYSGTQFDPDVVNAFLTMPVSIWYEIDAELGP